MAITRYPVVVCNNCGTQYNAERPVCPGYQCFEPTPDIGQQKVQQRQFRTGPVVGAPDAIPVHADAEGKYATTAQNAPEVTPEPEEEDDES